MMSFANVVLYIKCIKQIFVRMKRNSKLSKLFLAANCAPISNHMFYN
jgi:hypothetical protein